MYKILAIVILLFPVGVYAQTTDSTKGLQGLINGVLGFLNDVVIPFLLAVGFVFFLINAIRYFVLGSSEEQGREKAKNLAIYSVSAFVLLIIFWGIVNLIANSIGLSGVAQPVSDYQDPDSVTRTGIPQSNAGNNDEVTGSTLNEAENLLPPGYENAENCTGNNCYNLTDAERNFIESQNFSDNPAEEPGFFDRIGGWIPRLFDFEDRPFRDYFWADWGRSGNNNGGSNNDNSREQVTDYPVQCLLPNGTVVELLLSECLNRGGQVTQNTPTQPSNSFELTNCTFYDATTGQQRTIQTSSEQCAEYNLNTSF